MPPSLTVTDLGQIAELLGREPVQEDVVQRKIQE